jgi:hypothetical protein
MPTVRNLPGPYRFFFYSFDCNEPEHVHVHWGGRESPGVSCDGDSPGRKD